MAKKRRLGVLGRIAANVLPFAAPAVAIWALIAFASDHHAVRAIGRLSMAGSICNFSVFDLKHSRVPLLISGVILSFVIGYCEWEDLRAPSSLILVFTCLGACFAMVHIKGIRERQIEFEARRSRKRSS